MKKWKTFALIVLLMVCLFAFAGCELPEENNKKDVYSQKKVANTLSGNQPTPTDIAYSLERYNLIRRTYWVNGMREKANSLVCEIKKPLGYIVLFAGNTVVDRFVVDGKVSSLNSFLTPDSEKYSAQYSIEWLADVDGSYGENDSGIFFFTPNGNYIEWTGEYLYSDIPFEVESPIVKYEVTHHE